MIWWFLFFFFVTMLWNGHCVCQLPHPGMSTQPLTVIIFFLGCVVVNGLLVPNFIHGDMKLKMFQLSCFFPVFLFCFGVILACHPPDWDVEHGIRKSHQWILLSICFPWSCIEFVSPKVKKKVANARSCMLYAAVLLVLQTGHPFLEGY